MEKPREENSSPKAEPREVDCTHELDEYAIPDWNDLSPKEKAEFESMKKRFDQQKVSDNHGQRTGKHRKGRVRQTRKKRSKAGKRGR